MQVADITVNPHGIRGRRAGSQCAWLGEPGARVRNPCQRPVFGQPGRGDENPCLVGTTVCSFTISMKGPAALGDRDLGLYRSDPPPAHDTTLHTIWKRGRSKSTGPPVVCSQFILRDGLLSPVYGPRGPGRDQASETGPAENSSMRRRQKLWGGRDERHARRLVAGRPLLPKIVSDGGMLYVRYPVDKILRRHSKQGDKVLVTPSHGIGRITTSHAISGFVSTLTW